ncbi:MAG TPA: class I SAM-dependent methyltransferase [Gaiellaceae bacterium]|nr:class I SAM-dependent methyltransferase [Gaiellaceae bacterium]
MTWRFDPEGAEVGALRRLAPVDGLRVLELGCGDGRLTYRYARSTSSVLAVDPDEERIADASAALPHDLAGRVSFAVAGAAEVDAPRASFDLALFSWSL